MYANRVGGGAKCMGRRERGRGVHWASCLPVWSDGVSWKYWWERGLGLAGRWVGYFLLVFRVE